MKKSICAIGLFFLFSIVVLAQEKLNRSFTGVKGIKIKTASGNCLLTKATGTTVNVDLQHTFGSDYNPEINQDGDQLTIREKFNSNTSRGDAKWTLDVPDGIEVSFATGSGNFEASNLTLELDVSTGSGDISLSKTKGDVRGNTGSGDITLDDTQGQVKANSGSGNISLDGGLGELKLNCGSGDIRLKNSKAAIMANTGSGTVRGTNLTLTGPSGFNTGSGDAEVVLAVAPTHNISVNSGSGDAILDFNGNTIAGEIVMKANKRNGEIKAPFEFDKTEEIEQGRDQITIKKTAQRGNSNIKISIGTGSGQAVIKGK